VFYPPLTALKIEPCSITEYLSESKTKCFTRHPLPTEGSSSYCDKDRNRSIDRYTVISDLIDKYGSDDELGSDGRTSDYENDRKKRRVDNSVVDCNHAIPDLGVVLLEIDCVECKIGNKVYRIDFHCEGTGPVRWRVLRD
jgi:hypothetical protein